jgi:CBS domain containing-hemolysin-like protein
VPLIGYITLGMVVVFAAASFLFAAAETALFALGRWQRRQLAERHPARGRRVEALLADPERLLASIAFGSTMSHTLMAGAAFGMVFADIWPLIPTVASLLVLMLVVGEVIPKTLAVRMPERWALRVAGSMTLFTRASAPLQRGIHRLCEAAVAAIARRQPARRQLTDADYAELIEMAHQHGALRGSEREILLQIIQLDQRTVREVMQPRARMAAIPDDLSVEEMLAAARRFGRSRLPVYDETPDTIVGVLNTRQLLLDPGCDLAEVIEFPSFVPETMNLLQLLRSLQRQKRSMAIVLDEFGSVAGLVTLQDILADVVAPGGTRPRPGLVFDRLAPDRWRVSGNVRVEDFLRECPLPGGPPDDVDTMGGLALAAAEIVPAKGATLKYRGLTLRVADADERRVLSLVVEAPAGKGAR